MNFTVYMNYKLIATHRGYWLWRLHGCGVTGAVWSRLYCRLLGTSTPQNNSSYYCEMPKKWFVATTGIKLDLMPLGAHWRQFCHCSNRRFSQIYFTRWRRSWLADRTVGQQAFEKQIDTAKHLEDFLFDTLTEQYGTDKGNYAKQAIALIERIQDTVLPMYLSVYPTSWVWTTPRMLKKTRLSAPTSNAFIFGLKRIKGRGTPLRLAVLCWYSALHWVWDSVLTRIRTPANERYHTTVSIVGNNSCTQV